YHCGIFAFTGGGKGDLLSNILRRILIHKKETKVVIFDISCEYPFLLMDVFGDDSIPSRIILENETKGPEEFYNSVVKPRGHEGDERVIQGMSRIFSLNRVSHLRRRRIQVPRFTELLSNIELMKSENSKNPNYVEALEMVQESTLTYMEEKGLREDDELTKEFVERLIVFARDAADTYRVHEKSALYGWFQSRETMLRYFVKDVGKGKGYSLDDVEGLLEGETRLICFSISEPTTIKNLVIELTSRLLMRRKREFKVRPCILFVWDEAQEFVASPSST
ncbi:MAG: DUF87 domain-containing protein, partial [Candidatus Bathyarchaeia archaeon]